MHAVSSTSYPSPLITASSSFCCTDAKIYEMVAKGNRLTELGALIGLASVVCAFFFSAKIAIAGLIVSTLTIIADKFFLTNAPVKAHKAAASSSAPFIKGQPVGIENISNNCWANSMMQFILHATPLRTHFERNGPSVIRDAIAEYQKTQTNKQHIANAVDSQQIREWLASRIAGISRDAGEQEDAHEALNYLMRDFSTTALQIRRGKTIHPDESWPLMTISLVHHRSARSFEALVERNFLTFHDAAGGGTRRFRNCPNNLFFHLARFGGGMNKINDRVNMNMSFTIPDRWLISGRGAKYSCQAFIKHIGDEVDGGHYVAYVKRNGSWWCCDDETITKVSSSEATKKLKDCYLCFFARD